MLPAALFFPREGIGYHGEVDPQKRDNPEIVL
jgi:hypothetical protein